MKTLDEYNIEFAKKFKEYYEKEMSADVLCPKCRTKMLYIKESIPASSTYTFYYGGKPEPKSDKVKCSICKYEGEKMRHSSIEMGKKTNE